MNTEQVVSKEEVSRRLRVERSRKGWSQVELAEKGRVSQELLSRWERSHVPSGACDLVRLALAMDLYPDDLFLEDASSKARGGRDKLPQAISDALSEVVADLILMHELAGAEGDSPILIFRDHLRRLNREFSAQLAGRAPWSVESGARLPSQKEVDQLAGTLAELALGGLAERPEALVAADVAKRLGLLAALLPPAEDAGAAPRSEAAGPEGAAAGSASPERAEGPRKKASSSPRKKK